MAKAYCTAEEFKRAWAETGGSLKVLQERYGFSSPRAVTNRRAQIEKTEGINLVSAATNSTRHSATKRSKNARRIDLTIEDGVIVIGSDAHVWPGPLTTAQRGFIKIIRKLQPSHVILNGDVFDGAKISRHPAGIWEQEHRPGVKAELDACQNFTGEVERASPAQRIWTWGNHDARIEYTLAAAVPAYEGVAGFALKDHFPAWTFCMAIFVNDVLVIKHRLANGIHAAYNNAVKSGRSMVTGHLHSLKVTPWTDYNGTRYGVDCGTLADAGGKQFDYCEESPVNWRPGFVVLTFKGGRMLMPELVQVWDDDHVEFRGELVLV